MFTEVNYLWKEMHINILFDLENWAVKGFQSSGRNYVFSNRLYATYKYIDSQSINFYKYLLRAPHPSPDIRIENES